MAPHVPFATYKLHFAPRQPPPDIAIMTHPSPTQSIDSAREEWKTLYSKSLPSAAHRHDPAQKKWPVSLDHCFARIILDVTIGIDAPWTTKLAAPAYKNMTVEQLIRVNALARRVLSGDVDLVQLNQMSLSLRKHAPRKVGAVKGASEAVETVETVQCRVNLKRKIGHLENDVESTTRLDDEVNHIDKVNKKAQVTQRNNKLDNENENNDDGITKNQDEKNLNDDPFDISILDRSPTLSKYRKSVLRLLHSIPRGRWTTYKSLSDALHSSPRAVGNAMRRNPFAPWVPCHRVLASDKSVGGFGGDWGPDGKFAAEKMRMLREEGVRFDGKGKAVGSPYVFPMERG